VTCLEELPWVGVPRKPRRDPVGASSCRARERGAVDALLEPSPSRSRIPAGVTTLERSSPSVPFARRRARDTVVAKSLAAGSSLPDPITRRARSRTPSVNGSASCRRRGSCLARDRRRSSRRPARAGPRRATRSARRHCHRSRLHVQLPSGRSRPRAGCPRVMARRHDPPLVAILITYAPARIISLTVFRTRRSRPQRRKAVRGEAPATVRRSPTGTSHLCDRRSC
jgi:hypothetical protein